MHAGGYDTILLGDGTLRADTASVQEGGDQSQGGVGTLAQVGPAERQPVIATAGPVFVKSK